MSSHARAAPGPKPRQFTLVLAGGGARGYAHAGVLRALDHIGLSPAGVVGVSMGAIVAAVYALRADWFETLLSVDLSGAPEPGAGWRSAGSRGPSARRAWDYAQAGWSLVTGWGASEEAIAASRAVIDDLLGARRLEDGRIPVTVCATDLRSGSRVEFSTGPAAPAVYASSALAGVLRPLEQGDRVLVDGVYADNAPVDVARKMGAPVVMVIDPSQGQGGQRITNGLQAVVRAMEICHLGHSGLRADAADLVIRPTFSGFVDVLDFGARRACIAAGMRAVRMHTNEILRTLAEPRTASK